ncbi:hypothetical protein FNV43_RR07433 [Rhamnella rubrinervis]|uniref:Uncharacterized protein n=1 Tax=Rhamnella rubrinervis TaxID=2594499 RepID=A0A8K0HFV2_9ROSA|nr:hypothetical protein FNV43_RR07433 [Rhamnella rubrinervis]
MTNEEEGKLARRVLSALTKCLGNSEAAYFSEKGKTTEKPKTLLEIDDFGNNNLVITEEDPEENSTGSDDFVPFGYLLEPVDPEDFDP